MATENLFEISHVFNEIYRKKKLTYFCDASVDKKIVVNL